jgi:ABC-2 type transport system permease protein
MKSFVAFIKKEITEQLRSGRFMIITALFILLGIMNPAVAKLTPMILEIFADSFADSGITVTDVTVSALDSWVQFYKNIPIAMIAFVILQSGIFTKEYASGTLILSLTKGLKRYKALTAKYIVLAGLFTVEYWLCFAITYVYSDFFWDNSVAQSLGFSVMLWWLFGIFVISLLTLFSTAVTTNTGVLIGTGGTVIISYLIGFIPRINKYLPSFLTDGTSIIYGVTEQKEYFAAAIITAAVCVACFSVSIPIFNKKQL